MEDAYGGSVCAQVDESATSPFLRVRQDAVGKGKRRYVHVEYADVGLVETFL